jgi:hypothetical protein
MHNPWTARKPVQVRESTPVDKGPVKNASRDNKSTTPNEVGSKRKEKEWQDRLRPIYVLWQQFERCKDKLARESTFAEDFLIVLVVHLFKYLRQLDISVRPLMPRFDSAFKQHIYLALLALGIDADYQAVATWIERHHPKSPLPHFCDEYEEGTLIPGTLFEVVRDIGYLTAHADPVKEKVIREISHVRGKMRNPY